MRFVWRTAAMSWLVAAGVGQARAASAGAGAQQVSPSAFAGHWEADLKGDGKVHTFGDIYGLDGRVASALEGRTVHLASAALASEPRVVDAGDEQPSPRRRSGRVRQKQAPAFNPFSW